MWPREASWAPIESEIVSWQWLAVPDKYDAPRGFGTSEGSYEKAAEYADRSGGRVEVEYTLRSPSGTTWPLWLSLPQSHEGDPAIGSIVIDRSYQVGYAYENGPTFPTPEEATTAAAGGFVSETLHLLTPDGTELQVTGAINY